jgi:hypothetical protein
MKMARGKSQGIQSRNNREVGQRLGNAKGNAKGPGGVNQIGAHWGSHVTNKRESSSYRGDPLDLGSGYNSGVPFGNTLTTNVGGGGPGKGRDIINKCGSQGTYGSVNPGNPRTVPGKGNKDSLIDSFGPSYRGSGRG